MEIKKSGEADLEGKRWQRFLLGLLFALAGLFVALEYSFTPADPLDDADFMEQLSMDEELGPLLRPENEMVLAPKAKQEPTVKLKIVEEETTPPEDIDRQEEQPVESDPADDLPDPAENKRDQQEDEVLSFRVVEDLPQPPGGYGEFMKWLTRNLKYPSAAEQHKVQGKVLAEFIVNKDGSVTDVRIVRSLSRDCDEEALRVLRLMPRWTAGIQNDKPCRTKVCIPIVFKL